MVPTATAAGPVIVPAEGTVLTMTIAVLVQPVLMRYVIMLVPAVTPVKTPEVTPIVATDVLLLVQETPVGAQLKTVAAPVQIFVAPVMADGNGFTVTFNVLKQPFGIVYVITGVPVATPVTIPVPATTVASPELLLVHMPPLVPSVRGMVAPIQTEVVPVIAAGDALTVIGVIALHPPLMVYVILAVPAETPVTTPVPDITVAIAVLPLLHAPPDVVLLNVVVKPVQTVAIPVFVGNDETVTTVELAQPIPVNV